MVNEKHIIGHTTRVVDNKKYVDEIAMKYVRRKQQSQERINLDGKEGKDEADGTANIESPNR